MCLHASGWEREEGTDQSSAVQGYGPEVAHFRSYSSVRFSRLVVFSYKGSCETEDLLEGGHVATKTQKFHYYKGGVNGF